MAKPRITSSKKQREKNKQQKAKAKKERIAERRQEKEFSGSSGLQIDWESAPVNTTLNKDDHRAKEAIQQKTNS